MKRLNRKAHFVFITLVLKIIFLANLSSQIDLEKVPTERKTRTVKIINNILPSVAAIQTYRPSGTEGVYNLQVGAASVIHEDGYLITNEHVVSGMIQGNATLFGKQSKPFKVIASMTSEDLAIIKVDTKDKLKKIALGRSHDLLLGEPVITIGNPGGLNHSISTGVISGLNRSTSTGTAFLPWMIQTSAAVSGGNSGGPLINALGQQIGTITSKQLGSENINFAISIDRIRDVLPNLLSPELRYGFWIGIEVDMFSEGAKIKSITNKSPAQIAGLMVNDKIKSINGTSLSNPFDYYFSLIGLNKNDKIDLNILRNDNPLEIEIILGELNLIEPVEQKELTPGINYRVYNGQWDKLPNFNELTSSNEGGAEEISADPASNELNDHYGLMFEGYLKINEEGLYTFSLSSDDGSQFIIGDEMLINNDGLHSFVSVEGRIRLKKGFFPIKILYFENSGDQRLELQYKGPGIKMQPIPKEALFSNKDNQLNE